MFEFRYKVAPTDPDNAHQWLPFGIPVAESGSEVGPGTYYPAAFTREQLVEMFWRIRHVNLYVAFTTSSPGAEGGGDGEQQFGFTLEDHLVPVSGDWLGEGPIDSLYVETTETALEKELPLGTGGYFSLSADDAPLAEQPLNIQAYFFGEPTFTETRCKFFEGSYYPAIWFFVRDAFEREFMSHNPGGLTQVTGEAYPPGFPSIRIPLYSDAIHALGGELGFDPVAYWPYAAPSTLPDGTAHPNAGDPIWEATTGARLLDPITGL